MGWLYRSWSSITFLNIDFEIEDNFYFIPKDKTLYDLFFDDGIRIFTLWVIPDKDIFFAIKDIDTNNDYDYDYDMEVLFFEIWNKWIKIDKVTKGVLYDMSVLMDDYDNIRINKVKTVIRNIIDNNYKMDWRVMDYLKNNYLSLLENWYNIEEVFNIIKNESVSQNDYITTVLRLMWKNNKVRNYIFNSWITLFNKEELSKYKKILLDYNFFEKHINELSFIEDINNISYSEILDLINFKDDTEDELLDDFINFNFDFIYQKVINYITYEFDLQNVEDGSYMDNIEIKIIAKFFEYIKNTNWQDINGNNIFQLVMLYNILLNNWYEDNIQEFYDMLKNIIIEKSEGIVNVFISNIDYFWVVDHVDNYLKSVYFIFDNIDDKILYSKIKIIHLLKCPDLFVISKYIDNKTINDFSNEYLEIENNINEFSENTDNFKILKQIIFYFIEQDLETLVFNLMNSRYNSMNNMSLLLNLIVDWINTIIEDTIKLADNMNERNAKTQEYLDYIINTKKKLDDDIINQNVPLIKRPFLSEEDKNEILYNNRDRLLQIYDNRLWNINEYVEQIYNKNKELIESLEELTKKYQELLTIISLLEKIVKIILYSWHRDKEFIASHYNTTLWHLKTQSETFKIKYDTILKTTKDNEEKTKILTEQFINILEKGKFNMSINKINWF